MKILVTFKTSQMNAKKRAAQDAAASYYSQHPRLAFEPRSLLEHSEKQEYEKLLAAVTACGEDAVSASAEGLLISIVPSPTKVPYGHYYVVLYEGSIIEVSHTNILSARYVETIHAPYTSDFDLIEAPHG